MQQTKIIYRTDYICQAGTHLRLKAIKSKINNFQHYK